MAKQHLLLVDSDAKSLRVMEVSLKKAGFSVTTAVNGKDALEKVQISPPDLVLSDTRMPEMDGFELCRALKSDPQLDGVPFVFLTNQKSVEFKVKGLELGGDDYLTKPIYIKEIVTRLRMILQKAEKERLEKRETKSGFTGSLADMGVVDLVQMFELGRKTGTITISEGERVATVWFRDGRAIDAELGRLKGENAFYRTLNTFEGKFEVKFGPVERPDRIEVSTQGLLMEGMRRLDEWGRMLEQLPPLETVFEIDYRQLADRLSEIPDEVNSILRLFDGTRSLARVVDECDFEDLAALGIVSKLYFEGLIREWGAAPEGTSSSPPPTQEWLTGPVVQSRQEPAPAPAGGAAPANGAGVPLPAPALPSSANLTLPPAVSPLTQPANVVAFAPNGREGAAAPAERGTRAEPVPPSAPSSPPAQRSAFLVDPPPERQALDRARMRFLTEWPADGESGIAGEWTWNWSPRAPAGSRGSGTGTLSTPAASPSPAPGPVSAPPPAAVTPPVAGELAKPPPAPPEPVSLPTPPPEIAELFESAPEPEGPAEAVNEEPEPSPAPIDDPPSAPASSPELEPAASEVPPATFQPNAAASYAAAAQAASADIHSGEVDPTPIPEATAPESHSLSLLSDVPPAGDVEPEVWTPPPARQVFADAPPALGHDPLEAPPKPRSFFGVAAALLVLAAVAAGAGFVLTGKRDSTVTAPAPSAPENVQVQPPAQVSPVVAINTDAKGTKPAPDPEVSAVRPATASPGVQDVKPAAGNREVIGGTPAVGGPVAEAGAGDSPTMSPEDAEYARLVARAQSALDAERFKTAAANFRKALALKPRSPEARAGLGVALVGSADGEEAYREAIDLLNDVVKTDSRNARAWLGLGLAYQMLGSDMQAVEPYKKYLVLEPRGRFADDVRSALTLILE